MGVKHLHRVMPENNEFAKYHFILDEFEKRRSSTGKPESQKYRSAARQHVMRGVGSSKRKAKKSKPVVFELIPRRHTVVSTAQELHEVPQYDEWWNGSVGSSDSRRDHFELASITPLETPLDDRKTFWRPRLSPSRGIALNNSRLDPFTSWPVSLTPRMQFLMDYGM